MQILIDTYKNTGTLHHAYLIQGDRDNISTELLEFLEKDLKFPVIGNPDFWHEKQDTFGIDQARALRDAQSNKGVRGDRKVFIIETRAITLEAQNALLKAFEEPTAHTHFFIIIPSVELVLPTLRSRVSIISHEDNSASSRKQAKAFLALPISDRMKLIEEIVEEKNKTQAIEIVDGLIYELKDSKNTFALKELLQCKSYIQDRSPSLKLLLEHIALII